MIKTLLRIFRSVSLNEFKQKVVHVMHKSIARSLRAVGTMRQRAFLSAGLCFVTFVPSYIRSLPSFVVYHPINAFLFLFLAH